MLEILKRKLDLGKEIETQKYGSVTVYLDDNTRFGNAYFVTATKNGIHLAGLIDEEGTEVIPLDEMTLDEFFYTKQKRDICFGFKIPEMDTLKYYHVQKQKDNTYKLKISTNPNDLEPISIRQVKEDNNTWVFDKQTVDGEHEYAIYRPSEVRMLTCFFDELNFDIPDNLYGHFAYVCNYIIAEVENDVGDIEKIPLTTICAFVDYNGDFSSQLLDVEDEDFYNCYLVEGTSTSREYSMFLYNLQQKYLNRYLEKEERTDEELNYLFNNYNQSVKPLNSKNTTPAKILEFKSVSKNDN